KLDLTLQKDLYSCSFLNIIKYSKTKKPEVGYLNQGKTTISVLILSLLALLLLFNFASADNVYIFNINSTNGQLVHPSNVRASPSNQLLNGTVDFNITLINNGTVGIAGNITNVTVHFNDTNGRIFLVAQYNGNISNTMGEGGNTIVNFTSVNLATIPDGRYSIIVNTTNSTQVNLAGLGQQTSNVTAVNITVDNYAPAINYTFGSAVNNSVYLGIVGGVTINVTINDTSPVNITLTWANSTTVNTTTLYRHFNNSATGSLLDSLVLRNISFNLSLQENDEDEKVWFNITVIDQWGRSNTSLTHFVLVDGIPPVPTISSSAGSEIRVETATTLSCTVSETNPLTMSLKEGSTTICSASNANSCSASYTPTSSGDKAFTCTATDRATNTNSVTYTLQVTRSGSSGGGGSGGGSSSSVTLGNVESGVTTTVDIDNAAAGVEEVSFTVGDAVSRAKVTVNSKTEEQVGAKPGHRVYKYFEVATENVADSNIKDAKIKFSVSESWLTSNKPEDVVLLRNENGQWKEYAARLLNVANGMYHFESTVPGFSTFAIALRGAPGSETPAVTEGTPTPGEGTTETPAMEEVKPSRVGLIIGLLLVLVAVVVFVVVMKKRRD
ncbi:MAG: PGF-pre-PGF domain-containing protein, partial [Candidatus Nanoarchaeia archaeon]